MKICVIVVTFNAKKWVDKCLDNIKDVPKECEVVVVDNSSEDDTVRYVRSRFPNFHIIESDINLGFGKANNLGFEFALARKFDYFLLLNQDAMINWDSILELSKLLRNNKEYGIVSPVHLSELGNVDYLQIKTLCRYKFDLLNDLVVGKPLNDIYEIGYTNAAIWLVSKECLCDVGGFDPLFPHYGEDNDYCLRMKKKKIKVGLAPKIYGYHLRVQNRATNQIRANSYYIDYLLTLKHGGDNLLMVFLIIIKKVVLTLLKNPMLLLARPNVLKEFLIIFFNIRVIIKSRLQYNHQYRYLNVL